MRCTRLSSRAPQRQARRVIIIAFIRLISLPENSRFPVRLKGLFRPVCRMLCSDLTRRAIPANALSARKVQRFSQKIL
ncbi:hypothetical protein B5F75_01610 [Candidatus Avelusimicrobium gallicola]|uniref:Uncharacterized protein n=1 Tax=Candidatus Avelusimicrobium gallicola TaxID=2562704 RepID=A0A1Y4DF00_9BACT|nr:hypothetical protein B5F75_01610 [Elusimicrobium sp. An273]